MVSFTLLRHCENRDSYTFGKKFELKSNLFDSDEKNQVDFDHLGTKVKSGYSKTFSLGQYLISNLQNNNKKKLKWDTIPSDLFPM